MCSFNYFFVKILLSAHLFGHLKKYFGHWLFKWFR